MDNVRAVRSHLQSTHQRVSTSMKLQLKLFYDTKVSLNTCRGCVRIYVCRVTITVV